MATKKPEKAAAAPAKGPPTEQPAPELPPKPQQAFAEIGTTGLRQAGGFISADFLPELQGLSATKKYAEMANNDPVVAATLFAASMLLRVATWRIEPAVDNASAAAKAAAAFVEDELFQKLEGGWSTVVTEATSMLTFGFAPMEVVFARRDNNAIGLKKIELRSQETVSRWKFDDKTQELLGMYQQDWTRPEVFIPRAKLLIFRTTQNLKNPEGKSALRGAYMAWLRKKVIEESEGRAALRAAGIVKITIPGDLLVPGASATNLQVANAYKAAAAKLAEDRQGAIVLPSDVHPDTKTPLYDVSYVVADGRRSGDMTTIIERYDKRIASTILADFILLGQQAVGSFALSSDKTALFAQALGAWLQIIADTVNRELLPRWWALNGFDVAIMPRLVPGDVETPNLQELSSFIVALSGAGMPFFPDEELQAYLRTVSGLPKADEAKQIQQQATDKAKAQAQAFAAKGPANTKLAKILAKWRQPS